MASKTIKLGNIAKGEYLSWFATTQAAFSIQLKLYDNKTVYFDKTRQSRDIEPPMAQGSAQYIGDELSLYINIPQGDQKDLQTFLNTFTLLTPTGETVGHGFTVCGEDQHDADFNDFYLNVMGWKSKG